MRNWQKDLRRASYRGVEFWVDYEDFSGGKRLALHEVAGGRHTVVEELGLATSAFDVTLYIVSDLADVDALALQAAMLAGGPALLSMPMDGSMMATAQGFRRNRRKDQNGYVAFDATFIPAVSPGSAMLSIGDVSTAVATGFTAAAAQFALLFR